MFDVFGSGSAGAVMLLLMLSIFFGVVGLILAYNSEGGPLVAASGVIGFLAGLAAAILLRITFHAEPDSLGDLGINFGKKASNVGMMISGLTFIVGMYLRHTRRNW